MVEIRHCDREYLWRASAFIRAKAGQDVPFFEAHRFA
jgi:hypothetical protein